MTLLDRFLPFHSHLPVPENLSFEAVTKLGIIRRNDDSSLINFRYPHTDFPRFLSPAL